jgi:hypothetical protein
MSVHERLAGLSSFHRLLAVPLLLAQFRRSGNGIWVVCGFFASSVTVLIASFALVLIAAVWWKGAPGVPVHGSIFQGTEFIICGFGALGYAALSGEQMPSRKRKMLFMLGVLFLANFAFAVTSRVALVIAPPDAFIAGLVVVSMERLAERRHPDRSDCGSDMVRFAGSTRADRGLRQRAAGISRRQQSNLDRRAPGFSQ